MRMRFCDTSVLSTLQSLAAPAAKRKRREQEQVVKPATDLQLCGSVAALFAVALASMPAGSRDPECVACALVAKARRVVAKHAEPPIGGGPALGAPGALAWYLSLGMWRAWIPVLIAASTLQVATSLDAEDSERVRADLVLANIAESLTSEVPGRFKIIVMPKIFSLNIVQVCLTLASSFSAHAAFTHTALAGADAYAALPCLFLLPRPMPLQNVLFVVLPEESAFFCCGCGCLCPCRCFAADVSVQGTIGHNNVPRMGA